MKPQEKINPNTGKQHNEDPKKMNPSKPGTHPDQTPKREVSKPPVANPGKK